MPNPSHPRGDIVVVGDALIDELRDATGSRDFVGGAALNVAVGLALLGVRTTLIAMVGDDESGERIRSFLSEYGVRLVESPSERGTSRAVSDRSEGGEPRYEFNDAARHRRLVFDTSTRSALAGADLVVVSCYPFDDDQQVDSLLEAIDDPEHRLVVDGNPRSGMLHDRERFLANFERVAGRSLLVKAGDEDAELLAEESLGAFVDRLRGDPTGDDGGPAVLATAGRDGAALHHRDFVVRTGIVTLPGPIVDTMGAGDATLAAIVRHIVRNGVPASASGWGEGLAEAMTIAAATVRREGALLRTAESAQPIA
jgi:fructokinase